MSLHTNSLRIVGIGGTLRENSTSLWALQHVLDIAREAGATTQLIDLRRLDLPMFQPDWDLEDYDASVQEFIQIAKHADAFAFSTAAYHGTLAGITKNALDFLEFLSDAPEPYLHNKPVGLIATAGGDQAAIHSIAAMVNVVHSLRGYALPLSIPIHNAKEVFDPSGKVTSAKYIKRLDQMGKMLVDTALRFQKRHHPVS
ncbi:MAG: NADPH-dependent FMN reductase [Anaerolineae bacterium]